MCIYLSFAREASTKVRANSFSPPPIARALLPASVGFLYDLIFQDVFVPVRGDRGAAVLVREVPGFVRPVLQVRSCIVIQGGVLFCVAEVGESPVVVVGAGLVVIVVIVVVGGVGVGVGVFVAVVLVVLAWCWCWC